MRLQFPVRRHESLPQPTARFRHSCVTSEQAEPRPTVPGSSLWLTATLKPRRSAWSRRDHRQHRLFAIAAHADEREAHVARSTLRPRLREGSYGRRNRHPRIVLRASAPARYHPAAAARRGSAGRGRDALEPSLHVSAGWTLRSLRPGVLTPGANCKVTVLGAVDVSTGAWVYRLGRRCTADVIAPAGHARPDVPAGPGDRGDL
jgi:hypothetical protein